MMNFFTNLNVFLNLLVVSFLSLVIILIPAIIAVTHIIKDERDKFMILKVSIMASISIIAIVLAFFVQSKTGVEMPAWLQCSLFVSVMTVMVGTLLQLAIEMDYHKRIEVQNRKGY